MAVETPTTVRAPALHGASPRFAAIALAIGALYVVGAESTFWLARSPEGGVAFFPAAGVTLAAFVLTPRDRRPWLALVVAAAEISVDLRHGQGVAMAVGFAAANAAEPWVGASLLIAARRRSSTLRSNFAAYLATAVVAGPVVGALIGGSVSALTGSTEPFVSITTRWWIGDALGVLVIATPVLAWLEQHIASVDPRVSVAEVVALPLVAAGITLTVILVWNEPVIYIVLPVLMWSALRGGFSLASTTGLATALVAEFAVAHGHADRVFPGMSTTARLLYLQLFLAVALLSALLLAVEVGERVRAQRALRKMEQARLAQRIDGLAASAAERRRIARDVHDIVGHALNAVILQAGGARRMLGVDSVRSRELIESIERTGRDAFHDLDAALGLVDATPDLDPGRSLADLPDLVASLRDAGLTVDLAVDGPERPVPRIVARSAFRIAQEALTNVVKHGGGARASVLVAYEPDVLHLVIADDGRGAVRAPNGGRGLIGMRERVSVLGGRIETGPGEGGGFVVRASLPLKQK